MLKVGAKIDFKKPGSGRGRPRVGTVKSVGAFVNVETRLGETLRVHPKWVIGEHSGQYNRKAA